jgi:ATP-dependent Clp protease ATP-binding subunit ClpA
VREIDRRWPPRSKSAHFSPDELAPVHASTRCTGARPLRRFTAHEVETRVGRALLSDDVRDGATIRVDWRGGQLTVTYDNPPTASEAA